MLNAKQTSNTNVEKKQDEQQVEITENLPQKEFTQKDIETIWQQACSSFNNDPRLLAIVKDSIPTKVNTEIHFQLESPPQKSIFEQEIRQQLTDNLRKLLENHSIVVKSLDAKVEENVQTKPLGPEERFQHLASKNPAIKKMRDKLDLDIE